tara:strand:+ start:2942 stop:3718 length:777 start_codon:yes stop_codon:yes gene_type:complete
MKNISIIFSSVAVFTIYGCQSNPPQEQVVAFEDFLSQYKFNQFLPANNVAEPLSVMRSINGYQEFVSFPDDCSWTVIPNVKSSGTFVVTLKKRNVNSSELNTYFVNDYLRNANFSAILSYSDVESIELEFIDPYVRLVSRTSAQKTFNSGSEVCKKAASNKRNIVIHQLLGVKGVKFNFVGSDGGSVNLNAEMTEKANLTGKIKREAEASGTISIEEDLYVGYRAFSGQLAAGALGDRVAFTILDPEEVKSILGDKSF